MDIRLIAIDMDGTLLDARRAVSQVNADALRACEARGIYPVLASGRTFESVSAAARGMGLTSPVISANGARVDMSPDTGSAPVLLESLGGALSAKAFDVLLASGVSFSGYSPGTVYQLNLTGYSADGDPERGLKRLEGEFVGLDTIRRVRDPEATRANLKDIVKFVVFHEDQAVLERLKDALHRALAIGLSNSDTDNLEVMKPGASKGAALTFLMARLGLSPSQVMAFGDNTNDLEMLRAVGRPVAMENAVDALKAFAWRVAPSHNASGVGRVIFDVLGEART